MKDELEILMDTLRRTQQEYTRLLLENRRLRDEHAYWGLEFAVEDVAQFHNKFGIPVLVQPCIPSERRKELRKALINEERCELEAAINLDELTEIADGIADLIYVCLGTALEFGIPIAEVWDEVHRTNMLKVGGATREDGKIMKPEGWKRPDIQSILSKKGSRE